MTGHHLWEKMIHEKKNIYEIKLASETSRISFNIFSWEFTFSNKGFLSHDFFFVYGQGIGVFHM